jgi:hypothetical protein
LFLLHLPISLSRSRNLRRQPTNPVDTFWKCQNQTIKKNCNLSFRRICTIRTFRWLYVRKKCERTVKFTIRVFWKSFLCSLDYLFILKKPRKHCLPWGFSWQFRPPIFQREVLQDEKWCWPRYFWSFRRPQIRPWCFRRLEACPCCLN